MRCSDCVRILFFLNTVKLTVYIIEQFFGRVLRFILPKNRGKISSKRWELTRRFFSFQIIRISTSMFHKRAQYNYSNSLKFQKSLELSQTIPAFFFTVICDFYDECIAADNWIAWNFISGVCPTHLYSCILCTTYRTRRTRSSNENRIKNKFIFAPLQTTVPFSIIIFFPQWNFQGLIDIVITILYTAAMFTVGRTVLNRRLKTKGQRVYV